MKILSLNQDKGVGDTKKKGASIHVRAIRDAFRDLGHEVIAIDDASGVQLNDVSTQYTKAKPFDMVYERYALGKVGGSDFAIQHSIPHVLEVNAPLAQEAERWRHTDYGETCAAAERRAFANAQHIIAVSHETRQYSIDRGATPENVSVIPNGFDPKIFYPRDKNACKRKLGISPDKFVVGFHGRLRPWHRFDKLVDAVAKLCSEGLSTHLLSIGEGNYIDVARRQLSAFEHTHIEWVNIAALGEFVGAYDVLPLMYADNEPCYFSPLKLYEAMACGAVPVVPDTGGLSEAVEHTKSGLIYQSGQLVSSIRRLYGNHQQLTRMSAACVQQAKSHTWQHVAIATLQATQLHGSRT